MRLLSSGLLALGLICAAPLAAHAQIATEDELVVTGQRVDEAIRDFVTALTAAPTGEDQVARWDRRICPGVAGIRARQGQAMIDRLALRAFQVGLDVGQPGCTPNVLVFVTPDSDALARELATNYPDLVGYHGGQASQTRGREALEAFASDTRAVRWWHVSQTVTRDGQVLGDTVAQTSRSGGMRGAQVVRNAPAGRLQAATRQDFNRVLIIVDARRAAGLTMDSLGDYVAMVALAQLDPSADTSAHSTILNLFADAAAGRTVTTALTDWDVAYLQALYDTQRNASSSSRQEAEIGRRMREGVTGQ
jgi:hypothetical protein